MRRFLPLLTLALLAACTLPARPLQHPPASSGTILPQTVRPQEDRTEEALQPPTHTGAAIRERLLPGGMLEVGDPEAPLSMLLFTNHECRYCGQFQETLFPGLLDRVRSKTLRITIVPVSLQTYAQSKEHALLFFCAAQQGKGMIMHDLLFAGITRATLQARNTSLAFDLDRLDACLSNPGTEEHYRASQAIARALDVTLLPAYFLNGNKFVGLPEAADLRGQMEEATKR